MPGLLTCSVWRPDDFDAAFALYRDALRELLDAAVGWDETAQRDRFRQTLMSGQTEWLMHGAHRVGLISVAAADADVHVHILLIAAAWQQRGMGSAALRALERRYPSASGIRLSCLTNNRRALRFYQRHGYCAQGADAHFMTLRKPL